MAVFRSAGEFVVSDVCVFSVSNGKGQMLKFILIACALLGSTVLVAQERVTMDALRSADYMKGKQTFQGRCSACHTLANDSGDIAGPNLWGVFGREAGAKEGLRLFRDAC